MIWDLTLILCSGSKFLPFLGNPKGSQVVIFCVGTLERCLLFQIHLFLTIITLFLVLMGSISLAVNGMMLMRPRLYPQGPTSFILFVVSTSKPGESFYKCVTLVIRGIK